MTPMDIPDRMLVAIALAVFIVAAFASRQLARALRPAGTPARLRDIEQLACLAGGAARLAETAATRLLGTGALGLTGTDLFEASRKAEGSTELERAVLRLADPIRWEAIAQAARRSATIREIELVARGLLMRRADTRWIRLARMAPWAAAGLALTVLMAMKLVSGKPFGVPAVLLVLSCIASAAAFLLCDRRTRAGLALLQEARRDAQHLRHLPPPTQTALAVALFGTPVLMGTPLQGLHTLLTPPSD